MGAQDPSHHRSQSTSGEGESCILIMLVSRQPPAHPRLPREPSLTLGIFTQLRLPDTSQQATPALSNLTTGEEVPKERKSHILQPKVLFSALHRWLSLKQVIFTYRWMLSLLRPQGEILSKEHDMVVCTRGCAHKGRARWLRTFIPGDICRTTEGAPSGPGSPFHRKVHLKPGHMERLPWFWMVDSPKEEPEMSSPPCLPVLKSQSSF